jgi:hypothetical protein
MLILINILNINIYISKHSIFYVIINININLKDGIKYG